MSRRLIGLGHNNPAHYAEVADRIATVFERADDLAAIIVDAARSLSDPLRMVTARLSALLNPQAGLRGIKCRNAALALVQIGERSPELLAVADDAVNKQLTDAPAETRRRAGDAEETAVLACAYPTSGVSNWRTITAISYSTQTAATTSEQPTRPRSEFSPTTFPWLCATTCSTACSRSALPLTATIQTTFTNTCSTTDSGSCGCKLARAHFGAKSPRHWPFSPPTMCVRTACGRPLGSWLCRGDAVDTNTVGYVGYSLGEKGYATEMPWDSLACSPEPEIRRLAAALIPWLTDLDAGLISQLAGDSQTSVRRELALSIAALIADGTDTSHLAGIGSAIDSLRSDAS